jgi:hypothetical protein
MDMYLEIDRNAVEIPVSDSDSDSDSDGGLNG